MALPSALLCHGVAKGEISQGSSKMCMAKDRINVVWRVA